MKLVIGSSNFGTSYGLSGLRIKNGFTNSELLKLSKTLKDNNLEFFDTSYNYKLSHLKISKIKLKKKIITKISFKSIINNKDPLNKISKMIYETKNRYKLNIYAVLIHDLFLLSKQETLKSFNLLKKLKKKNIIKKFGASIYEPGEILKFYKNINIDYLQIPFNVFDNRFEKSNLFKKLTKNKTKIIVRSCFLQGLLTFDNKPPKKIFGIKKHLTQWKKWCDEKNISYTKACLHYIKNKKFIDYLIVGFNNTEQLNDLFKNFKQKKIKINFNIKNIKVKYIDPRKW